MTKKITLLSLAFVFCIATFLYAQNVEPNRAVVPVPAGDVVTEPEKEVRPVPTSDTTEVIFLIDRSGSMGGLENDTIGGFNGFVKKQSELGETVITTVLFDDRYEVLHNGVNAKDVVLTDKDYFVRNTTALLDAIGKTINDVNARMAKLPEDAKPKKVIFVITTDGYENASREFTYEKVGQMIKDQQEKYGWEFIFMGANIDASAEGRKLNIPAANAFSYKATGKGTSEMYDRANEVASEIRNKN